ncbi:condensation domain-containing protein [Streptomyces sp. NBC_01092]|uniref:condensation domain-containing protein n=1 Tax=Streptomyces sp. NBC_01092 TaxID=2903748 RepID=UPI0038664D9B|nr:condensation domain-containing protein [Streptomyces sp. NBC_01092]
MTGPATGPRAAALPLLAAQRPMWDTRRCDPSDPKDNCGAFFRLTDGIDGDALQAAVSAAYAETEALRVTVRTHAGEPRQVILPAAPVPWTALELPDDDTAVAYMNTALGKAFDLSNGTAPCAHTLIETPDSTYFFFLYDHITLDAYGAQRYLTRIAQHFDAIVTGSTAPPSGFVPLARLVDEETSYRNSPRAEKDITYWHHLLSRPIPPAGFSPHVQAASPRSARLTVPLPDACRSALPALSAGTGIRWPAILITAVACELSRISTQPEVELVMLLGNRATLNAVKTPTNMAKELPLRIKIAADDTFTDTATRVSGQLAAAVAHQRVPTDRLPTFTARTYVNVIVGNPPRFTDRTSEFHVLATGPASNFRANCSSDVTRVPFLEFEANPQLYPPDSFERLGTGVTELLTRLVTQPDERLSRVLAAVP